MTLYEVIKSSAPKLEAELHQRFSEFKMNSDNYRKEFFKISLSEIRFVLKELNMIE